VPPEPPVVDASPLIVLARAKRLNLLQLAGDRIVVPGTVIEEVRVHSDEAGRAIQSHHWIEPVAAGQIFPAVAAWDLGGGESAVLSWAMAHPGTQAILDDYAARTCAQGLAIPIVGTLGLALRAKVRGRVASARSLVVELRQAGLYLSDRLIREALSLVGE